MAKRTDANTKLDIPVDCGAVSVGKNTAAVGIKVARDKVSTTKAEQCLCGARVDVRYTIDSEADGDVPGQQKLSGDKPDLRGVADVHRFSTGLDDRSCRLTFNRDQASDLIRIANTSGRLAIERVGAASDPKEGDDNE